MADNITSLKIGTKGFELIYDADKDVFYYATNGVDITPLKGADGANGLDGKSAYELWVTIEGNEDKTIEDFFNSFKGEDGEAGSFDGSMLEEYVKKEEGKSLTSNDYSDYEKAKMQGHDVTNLFVFDNGVSLQNSSPQTYVLNEWKGEEISIINGNYTGQLIETEIGKTYYLYFECISGTADASTTFYASAHISNTLGSHVANTVSATALNTVCRKEFVATGTTTFVGFRRGASGTSVIKNVYFGEYDLGFNGYNMNKHSCFRGVNFYKQVLTSWQYTDPYFEYYEDEVIMLTKNQGIPDVYANGVMTCFLEEVKTATFLKPFYGTPAVAMGSINSNAVAEKVIVTNTTLTCYYNAAVTYGRACLVSGHWAII